MYLHTNAIGTLEEHSHSVMVLSLLGEFRILPHTASFVAVSLE